MFGDCSGHRPRRASKLISLGPRGGGLEDQRGSGRCRSAEPLVRLSARLRGGPVRLGYLHSSRRSAWSSDAAGMCGPLSSSRSSRTLLTHFPVSWLGRPRKSTFFVLNAHSGRRPRYSMLSSIRARCRPGSRGTTMTCPVCTGTSTGSLRSRTSVCWQALSSTRRSSSGKLRRGTIWPGPEAFGYALRTPTSLRFEATTGTCARCSLGKLRRSISNRGPERTRRPGQLLTPAAKSISADRPVAKPCQTRISPTIAYGATFARQCPAHLGLAGPHR